MGGAGGNPECGAVGRGLVRLDRRPGGGGAAPGAAVSAPRGSSFDGLTVADLCAPISAAREPEHIVWKTAGTLAADPRSDKSSNLRLSHAMRGAMGAAAKKGREARA